MEIKYIEQQAAIKAVCDACGVMPDGAKDTCPYKYEGAGCREYDKIIDIPPADVRPVIFCRDCKHRGWIQEPCHGKSIDYCRALEHPVDRLFFCGMGERKDSDG